MQNEQILNYLNCKTLEDHKIGYRSIGGFPGHEHVHPTGEQLCLKCGKSLKEIIQEEVKKERIRIWDKIDSKLTTWAKKAEKLGWIKCDGCQSKNGWYDWQEIQSSLLEHCGYFKEDIFIKKHKHEK